MYALAGEGEYVIPLLVFVPDRPGPHPAIIYIHPEGKSVDAGVGGEIEQLVKKGYLVAAPDVLGTGETYPDTLYAARYEVILLGRSLPGIQAGDVVRVSSFLQGRKDVKVDQIGAVAFGKMGPTLLHAAAFSPSIRSAALFDSPISYRSIVMNRFYDVDLSCFVAGALTAYDLPDLIGLIAPRRVALVALRDQMNQLASPELISDELAFPRSVYAWRQLQQNLEVSPAQTRTFGEVIDWCLSN
jgi:hypothetical protein